MSAHRYQSSFNGIIFNRQLRVDGGTTYETLYTPDDERRLDPTYAESDYRLDSLDLTRVTVEDFRELRQFLEGAEANESFEGVLIATGRGTILAASPADLEDKTQAMRSAFAVANVRIAALDTDPVGSLPYDFSVDTAGNPPYSRRRLYARPAIGRPIIVGRQREGLGRRFMFQLISFDPKVHSQTLHTVDANLAGQAITNAGDFYAYPTIRITFTGAGNAALEVVNATSSKHFVMDASGAGAGEVWVLDCRRGTMVKESDGSNVYSARVSGFLVSMFLEAGVSNWVFNNTGGVDSIEFDYRDAWA